MNKAGKNKAGDGTAKAARARQPAETKLAEVKRRLLEISDLAAARAVLGWDQSTYMPRGGARARARQGATLGRLAHEKSVDPALGKLLDELAPYAAGLPYDSDEAGLIRIARRDFEKAIKVPSAYVARASALGSASYDAWTRARPSNDFATMLPFLEKTVDLSREYAGFFAPYKHVADPLIDAADEGMTTASVRSLFAGLRRKLVPLVRAICDQPVPGDVCLRGSFSEPVQLDFSLSVVKQFGYDTDRGRLDKTHHPFCTKFSSGDVRITTRVDEKLFGDALFSTMHESGHALYEQGVAAALEGTPLGMGTSAGVHESQSRLWENVVGRGRAFWEHFYPVLRDSFPDQFRQTGFETFYRAINKVQRSLIRTDADEVTYNLHIMMRFDLELESKAICRSGSARGLARAHGGRIRCCSGRRPRWLSARRPLVWRHGRRRIFQSYTIGNILSAQFYAAAVKAHPDIPLETARGEFGTLHTWLREHLYQHGRKFQPDEAVMRATGGPMSTALYLAYLRAKYGELYRLDLAP